MFAKQNVTHTKFVQNIGRRKHHIVVEFSFIWISLAQLISMSLMTQWKTYDELVLLQRNFNPFQKKNFSKSTNKHSTSFNSLPTYKAIDLCYVGVGVGVDEERFLDMSDQSQYPFQYVTSFCFCLWFFFFLEKNF